LKCKVKDVKNLSQKNFQALDHFVLDIFCGSQIADLLPVWHERLSLESIVTWCALSCVICIKRCFAIFRYILQLALADTLFLLTLPFTAASELSGKWVFEVPFCKIKEAVLFVNYYASIYFLVVGMFSRLESFFCSDSIGVCNCRELLGLISKFIKTFHTI